MTIKNKNTQTVGQLIRRLFKWRRPIIIGTIIAFILACLIALILPEYYKSRTAFYAASPDLASPENIFGLSNTKTNYFGNNEDEERILAIASSRAMYDFLIDTFNLFQYYDIDSTGQQAHYAIYNKVMDRYSIDKSENDEIHIEFVDQDPEFTARVANAATKQLQKLGIKEIKHSQKGMISNYRELLADKNLKLIRLSDTLTALKSKYNILDPESQSEQLSTALARAQSQLVELNARMSSFKSLNKNDSLRKYRSVLEGLRNKVNSMTSDTSHAAINISTFSKGSEAIYNKQQKLIQLTNNSNNLQVKLSYLRSTYNADIPAIHVIEWAQAPEVKYWPSRTSLVLAVTILVFLVLCFYALIREGFDNIEWKEISHGSA